MIIKNKHKFSRAFGRIFKTRNTLELCTLYTARVSDACDRKPTEKKDKSIRYAEIPSGEDVFHTSSFMGPSTVLKFGVMSNVL